MGVIVVVIRSNLLWVRQSRDRIDEVRLCLKVVMMDFMMVVVIDVVCRLVSLITEPAPHVIVLDFMTEEIQVPLTMHLRVIMVMILHSVVTLWVVDSPVYIS